MPEFETHKGNLIDIYQDGMRNLELFILKSIVGIQNLNEDHDTLFNEINDFITIERGLKNEGQTCYISVIIHVFNFSRRFVLNWLMQDPFPFKSDTFSWMMKSFMYEFRKLDFDAHNFSPLLHILGEAIPDQYENPNN